ncbi:MAG: hypothetical protein R2825_11650 [Saprospiraceae bacterium]
MDKNTCHDVIHFQNDFNAEVQHNYPEKFTSGFVVQAAYMDDALKEIERCFNSLKLNLILAHLIFINKEK